MADKSKRTAYKKFSESLQKKVNENKGKKEFYNLTKENKINELEELIELAEKVSLNIDGISKKLRTNQLNVITFFFYFSVYQFICIKILWNPRFKF